MSIAINVVKRKLRGMQKAVVGRKGPIQRGRGHYFYYMITKIRKRSTTKKKKKSNSEKKLDKPQNNKGKV